MNETKELLNKLSANLNNKYGVWTDWYIHEDGTFDIHVDRTIKSSGGCLTFYKHYHKKATGDTMMKIEAEAVEHLNLK